MKNPCNRDYNFETHQYENMTVNGLPVSKEDYFKAFDAYLDYCKQSTLKYKLNNSVELSETEKESMYNLFSKGCRSNTKDTLYARIVKYPFIMKDFNCGIFERITFEDGICQYCAGQDYPSEIKTIRQIILGNIKIKHSNFLRYY
jgi:hypothetical protein